MAAVDPKPTYSPTAIYRVSHWVIASDRTDNYKWFNSTFGVEEGSQIYREIRESYKICTQMGRQVPSHLLIDEAQPGSAASLYAMYDDGESFAPDSSRATAVVKQMRKFCEGSTELLCDSRAAFGMWADVCMGQYDGDGEIPADLTTAIRQAIEVSAAGVTPAKMNYQLAKSCCAEMGQSMSKELPDYTTSRTIAYQTVYHTASHQVRRIFSALSRHRTGKFYQKLLSQKGTIDDLAANLEGMVSLPGIHGLHIRYLYLGSLKMFRVGSKVYICSHDQAVKMYTMAHRCMMAVMYACCEYQLMPDQACISPWDMKRLIECMRLSISELVSSKAPLSSLAKAMHTLWYVEFHRAYEAELHADWDTGAFGRAAVLEADALAMAPYVSHIHKIVLEMPALLRLEALRLHHIIVTPDTSIEMLVERGFTAAVRVNDPDPRFWKQFMNFSRTYELCMYLLKRKEWPNTAGSDQERNDPAFRSCISGKFRMPDDSKHGAIWISEAFPYIRFADVFALTAKDATRVPWDAEDYLSVSSQYESWEHNELLHALKKGNNLGAPMNMSIMDARESFCRTRFPKPALLDAAAKAENTKGDVKPRITYSANEEFRRPMAEFDHNCQTINDVVGCGSIRADPVAHERGMGRIAKGTSNGDFTSSHDISDWSGSQQREAFQEFLKYRAGMFKGINPESVSAAWDEFDVHVRRNGVHRSTVSTQGGFQGFPGTIDTGLHILILSFFLYRMAALGKIDRTKPTIAKATIDDCLAQIALVRCNRAELASELNRHYSQLGYEIDDIKSVLSHIKALYLNQAYIHGGKVSQGLKVFLKIDRPTEDLLKSPFDDLASCISGAKSAIENGGKEISMWYSGVVMSLFNLYPAAPDLRTLDADTITMLWYLPRGDGGLGAPSICDIIAKEHSDARAMANYTIKSWALARESISHALGARSVEMYNGAKRRPWALVSGKSMFFNCDKATRLGVIQIESIRRHYLREKLNDMDLAEPYRSLISVSYDEILASVYAAFVAGEGEPMDALFCSVMASHFPESFLDAALGKAMSARAAKYLLGPLELIQIQRRIKSSFKALVKDALVTKSDAQIRCSDIAYLSAYEVTKTERESFHAANNFRFVNHTVPSAFEVAVVTNGDGSTLHGSHFGFDFGALTKFAADMPVSTRSMVSSHGLFAPWKAKNWVADSHDHFRSLNSVTHKFLMGAAVLKWAEGQGKDIEAWRTLYGQRWLGDKDFSLDAYVHVSLQGHIKRSPSATGDRYHPIYGNRNIIRSCTVNADTITVLLENDTYLIDPLSILAAMYASSVLTASVILDLSVRHGIEPTNFVWDAGADPLCLAIYTAVSLAPVSGTDVAIGLMDILEPEDCFIMNDGGLAAELNDLKDPEAMDEFFRDQLAIDGGEWAQLDTLPDLRPTLGSQIAVHGAPPIAILTGSSEKQGVLVTDKFERGVKVRLLEVSGNSIRHLGKYVLFEAYQTLGRERIVSAFLGDADDLKMLVEDQRWPQLIRGAMGAVRSAMGNGQSHVRTAEALRHAGLQHCRYDNDRVCNDEEFILLMVRQLRRDYHVVLKALLDAAQSDNPVREWDYSAPLTHAKYSANPEAANRAERTKRFHKRAQHLSRMYGLRVGLIQAGTPKPGADAASMVSQEARSARIAYLAGIKTTFGSLVMDEDASPDWVATLRNCLQSSHAKILKQCKEDVPIPTIESWDVDDIENMCDILREFCEQHPKPGRGWDPWKFAAGFKKAHHWIGLDTAAELNRIYFVPHGIKVNVKVRKVKDMPTARTRELIGGARKRAPEEVLTPETVHQDVIMAEPVPKPPGENMMDRVRRIARESAERLKNERGLENAKAFFQDKGVDELFRYLRYAEYQNKPELPVEVRLHFALYPRGREQYDFPEDVINGLRRVVIAVQQDLKYELRIPEFQEVVRADTSTGELMV